MGGRPVVVGVAGGTASGKTTISEAILDRVGRDRVAFIAHDAYYRDLRHLSFEERSQVNYDHPDSLETELLVAHLAALCAGHAVEVPIYDFSQHLRRAETRRVAPRPVILVEGILIFADRSLREWFDIKVYVDADADLRFIRRLQRDISERGRTMESVIAQYLETVRLMHLEFVEPSKRYADVIIPRGGFNEIGIEMVASRVLAVIERGG
ncbi:MAG: uridine kinase [Anaerolineae bacterium]|nr:uridine kinase [Anaerolineae bacterium]